MSDYRKRPGDDIVEPLFGALSDELYGQGTPRGPIDRELLAACIAVALALWWFVS